MNERQYTFTRELLEEELRIWEKAALSLIDIRHALISPGEAVKNYLTPSSVFLFTCGGKAEISLDDRVYRVERYGLFHGGKGMKLAINPMNDWLEYYLILYRAGESQAYRKGFLKLTEYVNPFRQQYGFAPENPFLLARQLCLMYERWQKPSPLELFYEKAAFYQLVYEVYEELVKGNVKVLQPDIVAMAKHYIEKHYQENISIQFISELCGISTSQLSRLFKKQEKKSPQEYLIGKKISAAENSLLITDATVKEIALGSGFSDEYSFIRTFKSYFHMTPSNYRKINAIRMHDFAIGNEYALPYNGIDSVSLDKLKKGGHDMIHMNMRSRAFAVIALSAVLLLSACGANAGNTQESSALSTQETVVQSDDTKEQTVAEETRIIHMDYGDVEIPANPKRVVVAFFQGDLLALGIQPVGTSFNDDAVFEDELTDVTVVDAFETNPEAIMALEPDLIIWNNIDDYEDLSKIAPTLATNYYDMEFEERLRFFGEVFGCSDKAEQLLSEFEENVSNAKEKLSEAGLLDKTVILLENQTSGVLRAFGDNYGRGGELIYQYLGLSAPERIQKEVMDQEGVYFIDIGYEMLNEYVGDYIFSDENIQELSDDTVWTSLPAVKEGRLIQTSSGMFWFSDITSMNAQLDFIVDSMLKTVEN